MGMSKSGEVASVLLEGGKSVMSRRIQLPAGICGDAVGTAGVGPGSCGIGQVTAVPQGHAATRYDKRAYVFGGTVTVASIRLWLKP
jgi:hypothetical protein